MAVKQQAVDKINGMTKSQIKSLLENVDLGMANEELRPYAEARLKQLTPTSNPPFPQQAELDKLVKERDGLNDKIKAMIESAKSGNFSYKTEGGRILNTGRTSRMGGSGTGKRGNAGDLTITVNGDEYTSWKAVCDAIYPTLVADKAAKGTPEQNIGWRAEAYKAAKKQGAAVTLTFKSAEKYQTYVKNADLGWLPDWMTVVKSFETK